MESLQKYRGLLLAYSLSYLNMTIVCVKKIQGRNERERDDDTGMSNTVLIITTPFWTFGMMSQMMKETTTVLCRDCSFLRVGILLQGVLREPRLCCTLNSREATAYIFVS